MEFFFAIIAAMILVTGSTGFVGRVLVNQLINMGKAVRILLHPSPVSPNLPRGVPVEAVICSLTDERGLRAAMKGVDVVYHLAGTSRQGGRADVEAVDIEGTRTVAETAARSGVRRMLFLSHLGADKNSAYPMLKAKAFAESQIRQSGVPYTIFRTAMLFGPGDQFTTQFAEIIRRTPIFFFLPDGGQSMLQPLWIEDLSAAMIYALEDEGMRDQVFQVGGPEFLRFRDIIEMIMTASGKKRWLISMSSIYLRQLSLLVEQINPRFPITNYWLDYLAADRTCALDTLPRIFGLIPARMNQHLDYLKGIPSA